MTKMRTNQWPIADCMPSAFLALLMAFAMVVSVSCSKSDRSADKANRNRPVPVTVALVIQKDIPLEVDTFGRAQSKASVTIKAKVAQVIQAVHFKEGDKVAHGDLLFTLDSRSSKAALEQARAALSRDKVMSTGAQLDLHRAEKMLENKLLSPADFDKVKTNADALIETIKVDQAAIDAAQLDVENCRITSPIDGRAGKVLVHAGNLVTANDVSLVVINQVKPMDVFFSLPQAELDRVRSYQNKAKLEVSVNMPDDPGNPMKGPLTFIDNLVDASNGTIELGATLPNQDERLWPGRYVLVHLALTVQHNAIVVPHRAIVTSSVGQSVFVVKNNQTVEQRTVKVERTRGDEAVIADGLKAGEQVVTDGQLQLEDGTKIEISTGGGNATATSEANPGGKGATP